MKHIIVLMLSIVVAITGCVNKPKELNVATIKTKETATSALINATEVTAKATQLFELNPKEYALEVILLQAEILDAAVQAEEACNMIKLVWSNTIYEKRNPKTDKYTMYKEHIGKFWTDFNRSLNQYFKSDEYITIQEKLEVSQPELIKKVKSFRDYPEGCDHLYESIVAYHEICDGIINLALSPTGNLKTYSEKFASLENDFVAASNDLKAELDLILDD